MSFQVIDMYLQRHEHFLQHTLTNAPIPAERIRSAMHYSLFPGGKRIRPILVYLFGELIDLDSHITDVLAAAIELTHCYSLIHDDLPAMDNDDFRRGKLSCHKAFDEATAILVGDGLQALAIELLLTKLPLLLNDSSRIISIAQELVKASGISGMVSGQSLDLTELAKPEITETQLKEIHLLKTGKLISACAQMTLAAQISIPEHVKLAISTYASHIGLVFQMQDDYLDRYAPANLLGKGRSSDLANNKTTFATLLSKRQLEAEIAKHYTIAIDVLKLFDNKANALIELTQKLEHRSRLS